MRALASLFIVLSAVGCAAESSPPEEGSADQSAFEASDPDRKVELGLVYGALTFTEGISAEALVVTVECPTVADTTAKVSAQGLYKLRVPYRIDGKSARCAIHVSDAMRSGASSPLIGSAEATRYDFEVGATLTLKRR